MEVPESLFARLEDDIIVHIASALPLNDASNFMVTCKRTHTLANTRIDTWWNWVGATAALEEEFPLPESYTNEEEDQPLTPWRLRNDPRADANAWGLLSPRERVAKLIQLGQAMTNRIRRAALEVADYWWDGYRFYDLKDQKKLKALRANACRFKLATELSTLYAFEDEVRGGQLAYDTEDSVLCDQGPGWPGGSSGRDYYINTFMGGSFVETPKVFGNDELLVRWARGVPPFSCRRYWVDPADAQLEKRRKAKMCELLGPTVIKKFDIVQGHSYLSNFAELWGIGVEEARAKVFGEKPPEGYPRASVSTSMARVEGTPTDGRLLWDTLWDTLCRIHSASSVAISSRAE